MIVACMDLKQWHAAVRVNGYTVVVTNVSLVGMGVAVSRVVAQAHDNEGNVRGQWHDMRRKSGWLEVPDVRPTEAARLAAVQRGRINEP